MTNDDENPLAADSRSSRSKNRKHQSPTQRQDVMT